MLKMFSAYGYNQESNKLYLSTWSSGESPPKATGDSPERELGTLAQLLLLLLSQLLLLLLQLLLAISSLSSRQEGRRPEAGRFRRPCRSVRFRPNMV
jgi:hypothetical protein